MSGLRCRTFGKPLKIQFEGSIDQRNWASLSVSQCIIMIIRLENTSSAVPMISDDSPTIQSDRQKGPKGLIQCPQRFLEPFSRPPKLTNWSISPWLAFVEHGDAPRWRPNLPGIILMSATMQHETFQKWPRLKLGGKRRRSHTIYSLHLFTSCNENRHAKCPKDANSEFGQSDTPQAKQNRTGSIFQVGRHWTKEIQRIYQDWELPLLFLESAMQSWRLGRVGKLGTLGKWDDQRLPFLTLLSGTSLYCVLII